MSRQRRRIAALTALVLGIASACGSDDGDGSSRVAVPFVFDLSVDPAANVAEVDPGRADVLPAATLRAVLERQLAWHGVTLVEMMRAARRNDPNLQTWIDALADNTSDLVQAVGLVYGPVGARAFNQQWGQHTQFLLDYADAVRDGDHDAADLAKSNLQTYATDQGSFFQTATAGGLPQAAVHDLLQTHIAHMYTMLAADERDDTAATLDAAILDGAYLLTIANGLSGAMSAQQPAAFTGSAETPTSMFCTIVTGQTGQYVLTDLITADPTSIGAAAASFDEATGTPVDIVFGPLAPLSSSQPASVAATAEAMFDSGLNFAITG
jgi:hypothetical protein